MSVRILMLFWALLTGILSAGAQSINDLGELTIGETYTAPAFKRSVGVFKAPKTGKMTVTFKSGHSSVDMYTSEDLDPANIIEGVFNGNYLEPSTVFNVTEGEVYYIETNLLIQSTNSRFILYMDGISSQPFHTTLVYPQTNGQTMYDMIFGGEMFLRFSKNIAGENEVYMTYTSNDGTTKRKELSPGYTRTQLDYLFIRIPDALTELLRDEGPDGISPKAPFTVYSRITDESGNFPEDADGNGCIKRSYTCGYIPTTIVSAIWPDEFLSYWLKGDEKGIGTITFSNELGVKNIGANLMMGNPEGDLGVDLYRAYVPAQASGNTVTVDLTGVRRSLADMMSSPTGTDNISITVTGLYDINGQAVVSNMMGGVASYNINLPYKDLGKAQTNSDWVPKAGTNLATYNEIEVWISGLGNLLFDGFTVEYTIGKETAKVLIPMEQIQKSDESADGSEAVFTFAIPEVAKTADSVTIYPTNLLSLNGYDYDVYLTAVYNTFTFESLDPRQGSEIANLQGQEIRASFNYTSQYPDMYVMFSLTDLDANTPANETLIEATPMEKGDYNIYSLTVEKKMKLYQNHEYQGVFEAWKNEADYNKGGTSLGKAHATWFGTTPPYQSSPFKFIGITPEEGSDLAEAGGVFTVTFDNQVLIDKANSYFTATGEEPQKFVAIRVTGDDNRINPDDGNTYSTQWELELPEKYVFNHYPEIKVRFAAIDEDGHVLPGNMGANEDSYFEFFYQNTTEVETIDIESADIYTIYNLLGIKILETTDASFIQQLPAGIYIVNGKKISVR